MNLKKANAMETIDIAEKFVNNIEDSILIVDDSKFSRKILNDILREEGFTVIAEARNGQEAVDLAKERKPKYVFLDVEMPILDGLGALPLILEAYPGANVIMCTAMGQQNIIEEAVREGAKDYVLKPYKKESIISIMNSMIAINRQVIPFDRGRRNQDKAIEPVNVDIAIEEIPAIDNLDACKEELQEFSQTSDDEVKQLIDSIVNQEIDELTEDSSNVIDFAIQAQEDMDEDEPMEGLEAPIELLMDYIMTDEEAETDMALIESVKEDFDKLEIIYEETEEKELANDYLECNELDYEIESEGLVNEEFKSDETVSEEIESEEIVSEEIESEEIESEETESNELVRDELVSGETVSDELVSGEIERSDELLRNEIIKDDLVSEAPVIEETVNEEITYEVKAKEEPTNEDQAIAELVQEVLVKTKEDEEELFEEKIYGVEPVSVTSDETIKDETIKGETIKGETINDQTIKDETIREGTIKEETVEEDEVSEDCIKNEAITEEVDQEEKVKESTNYPFYEEIIKKQAIISDEVLSEKETPEGRVILNEEGSNSGVIGFDYLWKDRLWNQQIELIDPVFTQNRISSHSVIHNSKNSNNQIDLKQSELMLGLISSYICFKSRLQPEYYYSIQPQLYDQEGVRIFTYSNLSRRSKTKAPITMTEVLKLAAKKKQQNANYLSNAIVNLVEGKIDRLLS